MCYLYYNLLKNYDKKCNKFVVEIIIDKYHKKMLVIKEQLGYDSNI